MTGKRDIKNRGDIIEHSVFDQDEIHDVSSQDIEPYLERAKSLRDATSEHGKYSKQSFGCVYAATIPETWVLKMMRGQCCSDGKKYNVLSNDPDEWKRALVHMQSEHKEFLVVKGKPFAKKRRVWQ